MPLQSTGAISVNNINVELGVSGTTTASLGQSTFRTLAGVPSGTISMSNFYGKANEFAFTISSNQVNANLRSLALSAGWNGSSKVIATINSGVWVYSNTTSSAGLTVSGSFPGGVELINNGNIVGMGGAGGNGAGGLSAPNPGGAGAAGLSISSAISIRNNATIAGGGGGGGNGSGIRGEYGTDEGGGAGGGGGRTALTNSAGGAAGSTPGRSNGTAGGAGTSAGPGAGGVGGTTLDGEGNTIYEYTGSGGAGGGWGSSGAAGLTTVYSAVQNNGAGGAGGAAVSGNSNVTWLATGTRFGALVG